MSKKIRMKNFIQINKELIKISPLLFFKNFLVWLIIAIFPVVNALLISKIFGLIEKGESIFILYCIVSAAIGVGQGYLLRKGGIIETLSCFTINQFVRENYITELIETLNDSQDNAKHLDIIQVDLEYFSLLISSEIDLLCQCIFFIITTLILAKINFYLTIGLIFLIILTSFLVYIVGNKYKKLNQDSRKSSNNTSTIINSFIHNISSIQFLDNDNCILEEIDLMMNNRRKISLKQSIYEAAIDNIDQLSKNFIYILIFMGVILILKTGNISLEEVILFISLLSYSSSFLGLFTEVYQLDRYIEGMFESICDDFLLEGKTSYSAMRDKVLRKKSLEESCLIEFLTFTDFQINHKKNLSNKFNFTINKGDKILIHGINGSGKSIFIKSILGYNSCYEGEIKYNSQSDPKIFVFGYVDQNFVLLNETLEDNILLGDCNDENYLEIIGLLDQKNKVIGLNGNNISDGQRQRVAIARALAQGCNSILIFDNSFSMIDKENKGKILNYLLNSKYTVVFSDSDMWSYEERIMRRIHIVEGNINSVE